MKPGWAVSEATGDATKGSLMVERQVWPLFYLHWFPRDAKGDVTVAEAEAVVSELWKNKPLDGPLQSRPIAMPAHPGIQIDVTRDHASLKSRYYVWACPKTGRLLVADTNESLAVSAPEALMILQGEMARTVRCHPDAPAETFGDLGKRFEIPESELSYDHHPDWIPIEAYRAVQSFGEAMWENTTPRNTPQRGQSVALEGDPSKKLFVSWSPSPDYPMSYEVLKQKIEDHWRERASDIVLQTGTVVNDYWYMNGMEMPGQYRVPVPPTRLHKFRAWMWRRQGTTWFAVADVGGVRFGRSNPALAYETWNLKLEEMFQAIREQGP